MTWTTSGSRSTAGPAKDGASYYIHLFLEDTRRAQALLEAAATAHRDHSKPQAIVLGNLALALTRQGDLDEAAGRLHQAIDVIEVNRSGGGLNIVFTAAREMRPWRSLPTVQEVSDRPLTLMADGKLLYMAAPKLAAGEPFYLLDPRTLPLSATDAADRTVGVRIAPGISISQMHAIDLIVCGSVAVNEHGARLGKGPGYPDIEAVLLAEAGLVTQQTIIATTVHDLEYSTRTYPSSRAISAST